MGSTAGLEVDYLPAASEELAPSEGVLGIARFGRSVTAASHGAEGLPRAEVRIPVLEFGVGAPGAGQSDAGRPDAGNPGTAAVAEIWRSHSPLVSGQSGSVHYRCNERILFGCLAIAESADPGALQTITLQAYREILTAIDRAGFPHLLRIWNYLGEINRESQGLERYRQFNRARREALAGGGRDVSGNVPAACALGSARGSPLVVYFLAGRAAPMPIENPRQISAYDYPPEYGPRPSFSRASVLREGGEARLFISGTASIVGHETVHAEDPAAQTHETLANLEAVLSEANRLCRGWHFTLAGLDYKVYLRNEAHLPTIRKHLRPVLGPQARVTYLHADICRHDLLVEIEATGHTHDAKVSAR